ncbi:MAG: plasmid pRiA4b ORF-3 family protein [Chlorobiaceae bacterium]
MSANQPQSIFQLKVTLSGSKPPIWRRILVPDNITLGRLHVVLQVVMGWSDCHLHQFSVKGERYSPRDKDEEVNLFGKPVKDEKKARLSSLFVSEHDFMIYDYDFGDSWEHHIILEKFLPFDSSIKLPVCLTGKGACPPEDCGGVWGYHDLLEIVADKSHPDYEDTMDWLGEDFSPETFDKTKANDILFKYCD